MSVREITSHSGDIPTNGSVPQRIVNLFSKRKWEFEDMALAASFNNYEWYYHSTGVCGDARVSIVDEVVAFKYPTGSTIWIYFTDNESAMIFWKQYVGLRVVECKEHRDRISAGIPYNFKKNDIVFLNADTIVSNDGSEIKFKDSVRSFKVCREIVSQNTYEISVFIKAIDAKPYTIHKGEEYDVIAFSVPADLVSI